MPMIGSVPAKKGDPNTPSLDLLDAGRMKRQYHFLWLTMPQKAAMIMLLKHCLLNMMECSQAGLSLFLAGPHCRKLL